MGLYGSLLLYEDSADLVVVWRYSVDNKMSNVPLTIDRIS